MQLIKSLELVAGRACLYGEMVLVALAVQVLVWLKTWLLCSSPPKLQEAQPETDVAELRLSSGTSPSQSGPASAKTALPGQATLEWVLIGGIMVVIIIALLITIFRPQLEAIVTNIMNLVQQNTGGQTTPQ